MNSAAWLLLGRGLAGPMLLCCAAAGDCAGPQAAPAGQRPGAGAPFTDVHVHLESDDPSRSVDAALKTMDAENAARIVVMPPPFAPESSGRYDAEILLGPARAHADRIRVLGGGGTLNPMILESARTGDAGPDVRRRFRQRAEELLRMGIAGFGEFAAEHFAASTPYESVPADHPLYLLLADIAAEHEMPIVLHLEAVPQDMPLPPNVKSPPNPPRLHEDIAALERLLAHNRRARIVWAHAGWDNTGYRTVGLCRRLLRAHANLYMDVKIDPRSPGLNTPLTDGAAGALRAEWLALFREFPDRFVLGTDQHYPVPDVPVQRWEPVVALFDQLPEDLRGAIGMQNAQRLYGRGAAAGR